MTKPITELTAKQLDAAFLKAQREYARGGSVASIIRLERFEAEKARRKQVTA